MLPDVLEAGDHTAHQSRTEPLVLHPGVMVQYDDVGEQHFRGVLVDEHLLDHLQSVGTLYAVSSAGLVEAGVVEVEPRVQVADLHRGVHAAQNQAVEVVQAGV